MKIDIKHRWTESVLCSFEAEDMRDAVQQAVKSGANLVRANLYGANLYGANLDGANLDGANLVRANLDGANLDGANLDGANLYGANLYGANLDGANLVRANLYGANLYGANLYGANLDGEILKINPLQIIGLRWTVMITEQYMRIGCQRHTHSEWRKFADDDIKNMTGGAIEFWSANKSFLLGACKSHKARSLAKE